jgi:medium-chain acyl-[acyl-carrier-protein] hydrolase
VFKAYKWLCFIHKEAFSNELDRRLHVMPTPSRLIRTGAKQPAARLFCFHYAGGGASVYRQWAGKLPAWIQVCAMQLPGRETRMGERGYTHMKATIEEVAETICPLLDKPFYLFGHSMGAAISFELARFLRRSDLPQPSHLFVSARRGPQVPRRDEVLYHTLPDREFLAAIKKLGGTPDEVLQNEELMELFLPLLRADFTLLETYKYSPEPPLACPISAYCGTQDKEVNEEEMAGWREQTSSSFTLKMIPGGHFFIHSQQDLLLRYISQVFLSIS